MPAPKAPGSVQTELRYADPVEGNVITVDFTQPGAEEAYEVAQSNRISHPTTVANIRGRESDFSLFENGFEYIQHDVPELGQCQSEDDIAKILLPATERLVKQRTGATKVATFTHRIRSKATDSAKRADNKAPALSVHSDFTPAGALKQLENVIKDPAEREELLKGRVLVINVWRPLKTITRDPLGVCDWRSVDYKQDWITTRFIFPHGWNELGAVKHSDDHRWYFVKNQEPSEPLVFVQFDSGHADNGGMCVAHSAFADPEYVDEEQPRESMEIKMFAFVPEE